jgi:hypothetical protein
MQTFLAKKTISEKYSKTFYQILYFHHIRAIPAFSLCLAGFEACLSAKPLLLLMVIRDKSYKPLQYEITDIREVDYFEYLHKT